MQTSIQPTVVRMLVTSARCAALSRWVGAYQIQIEAVSVPGRQCHLAHVANSCRGLFVKAVCKTPPARAFVEILDLVSNTPDPIPTKGFNLTKPWTAEAGVCNDDGTAIVRDHMM